MPIQKLLLQVFTIYLQEKIMSNFYRVQCLMQHAPLHNTRFLIFLENSGCGSWVFVPIITGTTSRATFIWLASMVMRSSFACKNIPESPFFSLLPGPPDGQSLPCFATASAALFWGWNVRMLDFGAYVRPGLLKDLANSM